jgi:hypothetical protein
MKCSQTALLLVSFFWIGEGIVAASGGSPDPIDDTSVAPPSTVLDRLWIWTHPVGAHDGIDLGGGRKGKSQMTPVGGAAYLGVPNLYFIHFPNNPPPSEFLTYANAFRPMKRVVWSLTGAGGDTTSEGRETVFKLAQQYPNISGFVLDDFLHWSADSAADPWLATNDVRFPVTVVLTPPSRVSVSKITLTQTSWPTGNYRTRDFTVDLTENLDQWREVHRGLLPNVAGAPEEVRLPGTGVAAIRIRILSTHDIQAAKSCGLGMIQLWEGNQPLALEKWKASASSMYSERFRAENLLVRDRTAQNGPAPEAPVPASLSPTQLRAIRERLSASGRRLPMTCVVYTHQISPRILPHVREVDKVAMWTWRSDDLKDLEANFEKLERIVRPRPILLGCYLFDYGANKQMSVDRMRHQCELGLKWLREGRIEGMIFLASNVCDMGLPAAEWTRDWIRSVKDQSVPQTMTAQQSDTPRPKRSHSTRFRLDEDPISEGGKWINGGKDGLDWFNVITKNGVAYGAVSRGEYTDPTALLTGTWGKNQKVKARVFSSNQTERYFQEVEIRLRSSLTPHRCTGYEVFWRCLKTRNAYVEIVRWNGKVADWTSLKKLSGAEYGVKDGDLVEATIVGNVIKGYANGVEVISATDNTYKEGSPGIGFNYGVGESNGDFGFTSYEVDSYDG